MSLWTINLKSFEILLLPQPFPNLLKWTINLKSFEIKKLAAAIAYIQNAITLMPWYVRLVIVPVINKKSIINAIEKTLQRISDTFGKGSKVDIKGNEDGEN